MSKLMGMTTLQGHHGAWHSRPLIKPFRVVVSGGGIWNSGLVTNCFIYNNSCQAVAGSVFFPASATALGGGIYNSSGTVINSVIYGNSASAGVMGSSFACGGGIYNHGGKIINCTIYGNTMSALNALNGGGVYNEQGKGGHITNCIAWGNSPDNIYGENSNYCYCDNPLFVNTAGDISTWDFRLKPESLCIDTGTSVGAPEVDIPGISKPQGFGFDIGAYELQGPFVNLIAGYILGKGDLKPEEKSIADVNQDGVIDVADIVKLISNK